MLSAPLVIAYGCIMAASTLAWLSGRITTVQHSGLMTVVNGVCVLVCVFVGWTSVSLVAAASTALYAWLWWHSGGGDGTRRRLRSWARRFQAVRRTAPSHA